MNTISDVKSNDDKLSPILNRPSEATERMQPVSQPGKVEGRSISFFDNHPTASDCDECGAPILEGEPAHRVGPGEYAHPECLELVEKGHVIEVRRPAQDLGLGRMARCPNSGAAEVANEQALSDAVNLLQAAKEKVADYIDTQTESR